MTEGLSFVFSSFLHIKKIKIGVIRVKPTVVKSFVSNIIQVKHQSECNCTDPNEFLQWFTKQRYFYCMFNCNSCHCQQYWKSPLTFSSNALWCSKSDLRAFKTSTSDDTPPALAACRLTTVILKDLSCLATRHSKCSNNNYTKRQTDHKYANPQQWLIKKIEQLFFRLDLSIH